MFVFTQFVSLQIISVSHTVLHCIMPLFQEGLENKDPNRTQIILYITNLPYFITLR